VDRSDPPTLLAARRWLALHRRSVSAVLAFLAVLLTLGTLAPDDSTSPSTAATGVAALDDGERAVPLRVDDEDVAALLSPGDVVDVVATDARGSTSLIASGVRITSVPSAGSTWAGGDGGLVVVAAEPTTALAIAGAGARGSVTVTIHP
jgi:hypothetical protein